MAFRHGSNAYVSVAGTDISAYLTSASLDFDKDNNDTTTFGATWKANQPGLPGATFSIEGLYDPTASTGPVAVLVAALTSTSTVAVVFRPGGTLAGQTQHSFSANLTSFSENPTVDGMTSLSGAFQVSGAVTTTTQ